MGSQRGQRVINCVLFTTAPCFTVPTRPERREPALVRVPAVLLGGEAGGEGLLETAYSEKHEASP
eukprot:6204280-Pleurochrysis_carterae.AAC.1